MADSIVLYFPQPVRRQAMAARLAALGYRVRVIDDVADIETLPGAVVLLAESSEPLHAALMARPAAIPLLILTGTPQTLQTHYTALPISAEPSDAELRTALAAATRLLASERRLQTLLQASPVAVIEIDDQGECIFANAQWIELTGLSRDDCRDHNWMRVIHDADRDALLSDWQAATEHSKTFHREFRLLRPDGSVRWVYLQAQPLSDAHDDSASKSSVATFTDITSIKETKAQLTETTERFRVALRHSPVVVFNQDTDLRYTWIYNPAGGYEADWVVGKGDDDLFQPEDAARLIAFKQSVMRQHQGRRGEFTVMLEGRPHTYDLVVEPLFSTETEEVIGVTCAAVDISQRKDSELALAANEERFRLLFEHSPLGLAIVTPDHRLAEVNPAFCAMLGYTAAELRDKTFVDITHADDRALDLNHAADLFSGKTAYYTLEKRYLHKDGHVIWINLIGTVVRNRQGKVLYALAIVEDITARREAERLRIEHLEHQRDALVREVHHRIKNNLQGVISLIEQLKHKQPHAADALEEAAGQISAIAVVYGLHSHPRSTEIRPRQLVEAIVASISRLSNTPIDIRPGQEISGWEWHLNTRDTVSIALVVNELIYNAIKHAGADARVEVAYGSESGAFAVRIFNRPASLPPGFDFAAGIGLGTGLSLVLSLLPPQGARLTIKPLHDGVEAVLHLTHPCATATPPPPKESLQ